MKRFWSRAAETSRRWVLVRSRQVGSCRDFPDSLRWDLASFGPLRNLSAQTFRGERTRAEQRALAKNVEKSKRELSSGFYICFNKYFHRSMSTVTPHEDSVICHSASYAKFENQFRKAAKIKDKNWKHAYPWGIRNQFQLNDLRSHLTEDLVVEAELQRAQLIGVWAECRPSGFAWRSTSTAPRDLERKIWPQLWLWQTRARTLWSERGNRDFSPVNYATFWE